MRKKYEAQMTIEDHDFKALGEYFPEDRELAKMSTALDENPAMLEAVAQDLRTGQTFIWAFILIGALFIGHLPNFVL